MCNSQLAAHYIFLYSTYHFQMKRKTSGHLLCFLKTNGGFIQTMVAFVRHLDQVMDKSSFYSELFK